MATLGLDVITTVISNKPVNNGDVVVGVDKLGNIQILAVNSGHNHLSASGAVENVLSTRFDDPTYYSN